MSLRPPLEKEAPRSRSRLKPFVAGTAAIALGASGVFLTAIPASAAPGSSEAQARYLSGTLLERSLDDIAAVQGEVAVANADTPEVVTESGDLDLSVLGELLELQVADGVTIPLSVLDAGAVTQYAQASQSGASLGATGAVTDEGVIDLDAAAAAPDQLSLDLSNLIGDDLAASVANLSLTSSVNTATASQTAGTAATGDYNIAGLTANLNSPLVAGLSADILDSSEALEGVVAAAIGPDGSLASGLTDAVSALGVADVTVSGSVDLSAVVGDVLGANQILGVDGPVQVNLTDGSVTVDIAALLAANGRDLNELGVGEDILTTELVGFVTAEVDSLVNGLLTEVQEAVSTALAATELTVGATVGDVEAPVLNLSLAGSLEDISSGAVVPEITLLGIEFDTTLLTGLIGTTVDSVLGLQLDTAALDADLAPLYPALDSVLTDLVALQANVQESDAEQFSQTALRLTVLNFDDAGEALTLNLAQAAVGPNLAPTDDGELATVAGLSPNFGPEAGGTEVTITGTGLDTVEIVSFGGNPATDLTVVSPTELTVVTPAGTGLVDVALTNPAGVTTVEDAFTYVPAGTDGPGTIVSFSPTSGPEAGGTPVTIIGTGFTGAEEVLFGDTAGTGFTVVSDNQITVSTPAGTGSVPVAVNGAPEGDIVADSLFSYIPAGVDGDPVVTTVDPTSGPEAGGTLVTIGGSNLSIVDEVRFGDNLGTELTVVSDTQITVVTPAGVGQVPITLTDTAVGGGTVTAPVQFSYIAPAPTGPTVDSVTPSSGTTEGGTTVTIIGGNFTEGDTVFFGDNPATDVIVVNPGEITATTPAGAAGAVDVSVVAADGQRGTLTEGYTYIANSFANCEAAAAAGQVNFPSNDRNLDQDGDGIACETGNGNGVSGGGSNGGQDNLARTGGELPIGGILAAVTMLLSGGALLLFRKAQAI